MGGNCCKENKETKVVMYGPGNSGKTTVQKAIRLAMARNKENPVAEVFDDQQRRNFSKIIIENIIKATQRLSSYALKEFKADCETEENARLLRLVTGDSVSHWSALNKEQADAITALWPGLLKRAFLALVEQGEGEIDSNAEYFLPKAAIFEARTKALSADDILQIRQETKKMEVFEVPFMPEPKDGCFGKVQPTLEHLQLLDLGGQVAHQKHAEKNDAFGLFRATATAIFLVIPIGDFDVVDPPSIAGGSHKGRGLDRFHQSLRLLDQMLGRDSFNTWHKPSKTLVIFMNKFDIFRRKIETRGADKGLSAYEAEQDYPWKASDKALEEEAKAIKGFLAQLDHEMADIAKETSKQASGSKRQSAVDQQLETKRVLKMELEEHLSSLEPGKQKYLGAPGDVDASFDYFHSIVKQRIHAAIRRGHYSQEAAQFKILKSTAVEFKKMRITCKSIIDDFVLKTWLLVNEMGIIEAEESTSNPIAILSNKSKKGIHSDSSSAARAKANTITDAVAEDPQRNFTARKRTSVFDISSQYPDEKGIF